MTPTQMQTPPTTHATSKLLAPCYHRHLKANSLGYLQLDLILITLTQLIVDRSCSCSVLPTLLG